jgi:hypothetical protein
MLALYLFYLAAVAYAVLFAYDRFVWIYVKGFVRVRFAV